MGHHVSRRFFRTTVAVYLAVGSQLDEAYSYPNEATKTLRALPVLSDLPTDESGRVYVDVSAVYCGLALTSAILAELIASGHIEEITENQYVAVLQQVIW